MDGESQGANAPAEHQVEYTYAFTGPKQFLRVWTHVPPGQHNLLA